MIPAVQEESPKDGIMLLPNLIQTKAKIITNQTRSEVDHVLSQGRSRKQKEWYKLVRVNLNKLLQQHPSCLQDSWFLVKFFIKHQQDKNLDNICNQWYWLEYHTSNSHQTLSLDYRIVQPYKYLEVTTRSKYLVPYWEHVHINNSLICIHGPFDFAKLNNRQTRDRCSEKD